MRLYGTLADGKDARLAFDPSLRDALDKADAVYNSICADIDAHIEREGLQAPEPIALRRRSGSPTPRSRELDLAAEGVTSIVWAIGYRPDYRWIEASAFDGGGRPMQNRGVTGVEGLTFVGLPWMHTWGSGRFLGIDRDARHIAETIIDDLRHQKAPRLAVAR